jgi:hypothetical protein
MHNNVFRVVEAYLKAAADFQFREIGPGWRGRYKRVFMDIKGEPQLKDDHGKVQTFAEKNEWVETMDQHGKWVKKLWKDVQEEAKRA